MPDRLGHMTKFEKDLKEKIENLEVEEKIIRGKLALLKNQCKHSYTIPYGYMSVKCDICGLDLGWWCPNSPNHVCDYEQEDGSYDEDCCKYCGQPEERK